LVVIGLDYFLGSRSPYRPQKVPNYMLRRYQKEYIPTSIAWFFSAKYNRTIPEEKSLMAEMIYHGKSYYFAEKMTPFAADSILLGYTAEQVESVADNEEAIWAHFVENNLFYEKSDLARRNYIDERPFTNEINSKCPGRIGRWLGWRIVSEYMRKNPDITLAELMNNTNAQEIFEKSKYKPKKKSD
jgi:uncharacterized protein YjaZ